MDEEREYKMFYSGGIIFSLLFITFQIIDRNYIGITIGGIILALCVILIYKKIRVVDDIVELFLYGFCGYSAYRFVRITINCLEMLSEGSNMEKFITSVGQFLFIVLLVAIIIQICMIIYVSEKY